MSNAVTVVGNLTRDPELRYTAKGISNVGFGIAVTRKWKTNDEWEEATSFFNVVCWRELADNVASSLTKGSRCIVTGRIEQRSWETDSGDKRSVVEIVADEVGPSLKFATASVARVERDKGDGSGTPRQSSKPKAAAKAATNDYDYGEEPF